MADRSKPRHEYAPLSEEARAWEAEQLGVMGLVEEVAGDAGFVCRWCGCRHAGDEAPSSGVFVSAVDDSDAEADVEAMMLLSCWWQR